MCPRHDRTASQTPRYPPCVDRGWITDAQVTVVAGKGGVGSSTAAAVLAIVAARAGASVLLISVDGRPGLGPMLGGNPIDEHDQILQKVGKKGVIRGRTIPPRQAFSDYLELKGVGGPLRKTAAAASLDSIAAATPGLEHLLVLGKIKELARERAADVIIVDAPPAGHAAAFLHAAPALQEMVASGPIRTQADEVAAMLADRARCQAMLVTLPEETPVNEVIELAFDIEHRLAASLAALVVNSCWPDRPGLDLSLAAAAKQQGVKLAASQRRALDAASNHGVARQQLQRTQLARVAEALPLPIIRLPRLPTANLGPRELEHLADAFTEGTA
jgi:arsenite/tail-anchored protein-transporting ATPase